MFEAQGILRLLQKEADPGRLQGMARYGINTRRAMGVSMPLLRQLAREIIRKQGRDQTLADELWSSEVHEARILAALVGDPKTQTGEGMDQWAGEIDSWDICDQCCNNLFRRSPLAWAKVDQWSDPAEGREFVRRAGLVLIACLAVHDKAAAGGDFEERFPRIIAGAADGRRMVWKAASWALRQIGKRNSQLHPKALALAQSLRGSESGSARAVGGEASRELLDAKVLARLGLYPQEPPC